MNSLFKNKLKTKNKLVTTLFFLSGLVSSFAYSNSLTPPPYNVTDRHSVNMISGKLAVSLQDVSIGGPLGLSHSISTRENDFVGNEIIPNFGSIFGPVDNYWGVIYPIAIGANRTNPWAIMVNDGESTLQFYGGNPTYQTINGVTYGFLYPDASGCFAPKSDLRSRFCFDDVNARNYLILTKVDGTRVYYPMWGSNMHTNNYQDMVKIVRPNGLTININYHTQRKPANVYTNSGWQLKYYFVQDTRTMSQTGVTVQPNIYNQNISQDSSFWSNQTPRYVVGINKSQQVCTTVPNAYGVFDNLNDCSGSTWPKAEYVWPAGMPYRMYVAQDTFSVIKPDGTKTDYVHTPFDKSTLQSDGTWQPAKNTWTVPLIAQVKNASANRMTMNYSYINKGIVVDSGNFSYYKAGPFGVIASSWIDTDVINYDIGSDAGAIGKVINHSSGYQAITQIDIKTATSAPWNYTSWKQTAAFTGDEQNKMTQFTDYQEGYGAGSFVYDGCGNLTSVNIRGGTQTAGYSESCTAQGANCDYSENGNFRICHKPVWTKDALGNQTDYTYHQLSGEIASVTAPADKNGKRAVTTFEYQQISANFYGDTNVMTTGSPIWLKTAERTCISNPNCFVNGDNNNADLVLKRFEYDVNRNLALIGVTVTAADTTGAIKTKRTCYQYDKLGRQIGETQPNAQLSTCAY